ncbi:Ig-like domain-containing protein [Acidovorax sp. LjRoot74]|uniref:Ig-like domain-containing protein n=1 Tax=Acidovorax sp. LjRoot74 TaxID=3342337 RepID=UPI003ECE444B
MTTDTHTREIFIVDSRVQDVATLLKGLPPGAEVVVLKAGEDGLQQMAAALGERGDVRAVHVLAHGSEGQLLLGNTVLGNQLDSHSAQLTAIGRAMTPDGDLLVYACDVGAGEGGAQFVSTLAQLTGADVAASTDLTGAAALGGNWALEAHEGKIDTKTLEIADYQDVFTLISLTGMDADYSSTTIVKQVNGQNITFTGGAAAGGLGIDNFSYSSDGLYSYQGPTNEIKLTITAAAGYSFDINSFAVGVLTGSLTIDFTYADGTTDTLTVNSLANSWQTLINGSLSKPINDVKQVVFSSGDFGLFQNFDITDVKAVLHPPTVTVSSASLSADTGTSGSDFITKTAAQTISGTLSTTLSTGEKVQVSYDNGGSWSDATTYAVGSSSWSTTTTLAGSSTFQARVTNADGSSTAYTHSYTLDTTAPTTSFTAITLSADTGTSSSDLITKTASQTITATLSGAPAGTDIVWGSVDGGSHWTDVTSKVAGTSLTWNGATLGAGSNAIAFKVTDAAGNDSGLSSQNYTLDTTSPTTTVASASFSNDSGTSSSDFITRTAAQDLSGTLSANLAAGESVLVSLDNGATWATATTTVGQNTWSLTGRTLTASNTLKVKVSDTAGNDGSVLSQAYQYDITAPTTTFSNLSLSADTGASATDFITKTAAQTITATLSNVLSGGDILYGSLDNGATWTDITSKVSGTALTWNGVTLTASDTLQLRVTDSAGNDGTVRSQAYALDTNTPATPGTPVLNSASDSGLSNSDGITSDTTPTLTGNAENGSTVTVFDGATLLGAVTAGAGGWTLTTGVLAEGGHTITVVSTDTAGNASAASAALAFTVDTTAPAVTSVTVPADGTYYSGAALDFTANFFEAVVVDTSGGTPRIALVVGATTRYADYVSGSGTSALLFRYTVQSGDVDANGITVGALSVNGGTLRDAAGNSAATTLNSVASTAAVDVDGSNPSITNVSASTADGAYAVGSTVTITVDFSTAVDVDTTGGIPTLALDGGGSATYSGGSGSSTLTFVYTVGAGQNSADLDYSSTGALTLNGATIVDAGGSHQPAALTLATPGAASSLGANKDLVIDTTAPTNTIASATFSADTGTSATDFITKTAAQTLSGTLVSNLAGGEKVYVSLDNGSTWVLAAASAGASAWSLPGQTLVGSNTLQVRVVDDAGNSGTAYGHAYVLDTTAPTISFNGIALSADTGVAGDLITHTAAQTISATLSGAPAAGDVVYGSLDNGATWTDVTSKVSGTTLTWNGVTLAGSNTLQLRVSDVAGNNGTATNAAYVLDTTAPTTSVASVVLSADTGVSSTDFITKTAAQTVSGTLSANLAAGEQVLVSLNNGATWTAATSTVGNNAWSLGGQTLSVSDTLLVKVTDTAGNDGAVLGQAYIYDTAATVPTVAALSSQSLTPVLTGAAALGAGETMTVTVGGATYDVVPVAGAWSLDLATAVPATGTLTLALNQRYEVVATVTDLAGNVASDTTAGELLLGTLPVTPDPEPPVTPPVTPPTPGVPDNDGVPNAVEDLTPGIPGPGGTTTTGDGNGDGVRDSEQPGVASIGFVLSPTGESNPGNAPPTFTTLVASSQDGKVGSGNDNSRITSLKQLDAPQDLPAGMQMPIGLVSFTVELGQGKTGENFSLYVDPALGVNGYWKENASGQWVNIASEPYGGKMVMEGGRLRLDFHIEDGGQFDADGKVDGIITDPGAPGHMALSVVGMAPDMPHGFWF